MLMMQVPQKAAPPARLVMAALSFLLVSALIYTWEQKATKSGNGTVSHFVAHRPKDLVEEDKDVTDQIHIIGQGNRKCRSNAFVILAQKTHSSYKRDSYGPLLETLDLLRENYLSIDDHDENTDVFLFHTGDFDEKDLPEIESRLGDKIGILKLVNLDKSVYWYLPRNVRYDDQRSWAVIDNFSVGYRHMCRWFGILIWKFFEELNESQGCQYRYIARLDEDSLVQSPINYDIFDFMQVNKYAYGYRLCAYELDFNRLFPWFRKWHSSIQPMRKVAYELCGFYNNFFVADLQFFWSPPVQTYLQELDEQGLIYRERYGDLLIHSTAVYAFAPEEKIHRFLDFTYRHHTIAPTPRGMCVAWGAVQAGFNDPNAETTLDDYFKTYFLEPNCDANVTYMSTRDLSPSYSHLPSEIGCNETLKTISVGKVELPLMGINSG